jgi:hypothetical protein
MGDKKAPTNLEILDSCQAYIDAVKEDMKHHNVTEMESIETCDRCGGFLLLVLKEDGDIKYFCPKDKMSIGWEAMALRGLR